MARVLDWGQVPARVVLDKTVTPSCRRRPFAASRRDMAGVLDSGHVQFSVVLSVTSPNKHGSELTGSARALRSVPAVLHRNAIAPAGVWSFG